MNKKINRSSERGTADYGWLKSRFSFSFSGYYNPQRVGFGKLLVLNDDTIAPGNGFATHKHNNMEIITLPTKGKLVHKDSTGSEKVIYPGQIQVMSAGSGIYHSEYNHSKTEELRLFQIWIKPDQLDLQPRHEIKTLNLEKNKLIRIISGNKDEETLFIYQDATFWLGSFDQETKFTFATKNKRGTFIMVIKGLAIIENESLNSGDSIEINAVNRIQIKSCIGTELLIIDTIM